MPQRVVGRWEPSWPLSSGQGSRPGTWLSPGWRGADTSILEMKGALRLLHVASKDEKSGEPVSTVTLTALPKNRSRNSLQLLQNWTNRKTEALPWGHLPLPEAPLPLEQGTSHPIVPAAAGGSAWGSVVSMACIRSPAYCPHRCVSD